LDSLNVDQLLVFRLVYKCSFQWVSDYKEKLNLHLTERTIKFESLEDISSFIESIETLQFNRLRFEVLPYGKELFSLQQFTQLVAPYVKHIKDRKDLKTLD